MKKSILLSLLFVAVLGVFNADAQGRQAIRDAIRDHGCRNVAITRTNGDLMLYETNGNTRVGCPTALNNALNELNGEGKYIDDVVLTESGEWLVLYGKNGFRWSNVPSRLERKMREYNENDEEVFCAVFNDSGDWVIVSDKHFATSSDDLTDWLKGGMDNYGQLWHVCLTDDCAVAVYENGYRFRGDVPQGLRDKLDETDMDVYRLKIAGNSWFIADRDGHYAYSM